MKKNYLKSTKTIICYLLVFMSFNLSAQWTQTTFTAPNNPSISNIINDGVNIYAGTIGLLSANQISDGIFKSSNGGNTWATINNGLGNDKGIFSMITIANSVLASASNYNTTYKSINQGTNWTQITNSLAYATFAKKDTIVFERYGNYILKSTDHGTTWTSIYNSQFSTQSSSHWGIGICVKDSSIYAAEGNGLVISHDMGATWTSTGNFANNEVFHTIIAVDTVVFASTLLDGIYKSNDKGITWSKLTNFANANGINTAIYSDSTSIYVLDSDKIYRSTDLGASWTSFINPLNNALLTAISSFSNELYVGTSDGQIWKTGKNFPNVSFNNPSCFGNSNCSINVTSPGNGVAPFQYSINNGVSYQSSNTFTALAAGSYSIIVKDANNNLSQMQITELSEPGIINSNPTIIKSTCGIPNGQITSAIAGGVSPYAYAWSNGNNTANLINVLSGVYTLTVTDNNSCVKSFTYAVNTNPIANAIPICAISADSLSTHNIVVWEKTNVPSTIDTFWVFRETSSNVFSKIGSVSNDSISEFHDYSANPNATSYKYKIGAINTCGDTTSALSNFHNTIHLQYLGLGNLLWSLYNIENSGNPVNFYIVNRDDLGNGNFVPISSTIPGSNTSFTDVNYTNFPNAKYRVDVNWNITCNSTQKMYSTIKSNIISIAVTGANEMEIANNFQVYPNPFKSETTIQFADEQKNTLVKVIDILGKEITRFNVNGKKHVFYNDNLEAGIYFFHLIDSNKSSAYRKIIVE